MATSKLQVYARHAVQSSRYTLSLSPRPPLVPLFACTTRLVHGAVLVVCTLVKHRWNRPARGFYALPRSYALHSLVRFWNVGTESIRVPFKLSIPSPSPAREPRTERILAAGDTGIWASSEFQRSEQAWNLVGRGFIRSRSFVVVAVVPPLFGTTIAIYLCYD